LLFFKHPAAQACVEGFALVGLYPQMVPQFADWPHRPGKQTFKNGNVKVRNRLIEVFPALQEEFGKIGEKAREELILNLQSDFGTSHVSRFIQLR